VSDPFAPLKEGAWREVQEIAARLARGEIDEAGWHREMRGLVEPAYLAAGMPWEQSGKSGSAEDWEWSRSHIADAIDRDGTFLDVGCANGYLIECLPQWTSFDVEPYGLDISAELVALARQRLPEWHDRFWVGNALSWEPPRGFTYIRTGLEYVPIHRRAELVGHLLEHCERLIVGVFNEHESEGTTEDFLKSMGLEPTGRSERLHREHSGMRYRVLWLNH
jgi:SAM-dependent methyltransferase